MTTTGFPIEGGCDCRAVRYRMETAPLFVHCCHCRWCQRETGASFALNAMIETDRVTLLAGRPETGRHALRTAARARRSRAARPAASRSGAITRARGAQVAFVRVGTLDDPDALPPDIHIFTSSKQPWVVLPPGTPAVPEYYDRKQQLAAGKPRPARGATREAAHMRKCAPPDLPPPPART